MHYAVVAQAVSKRYRRYHTDRPRTIMETALWGYRRLKPIEQFWALRDVSFAVLPGQMLGIIGHNGAGKSTLLQILSGVIHPDEGKVQVRGRMGALLDLGSSFHPDLTGRENVFVSAVIAGLTHRETANRLDAIVEFAELHSFIDQPVRTYSTGMQMRLAFSVAIHTDPEVLLVDEFLSVGDLAFQAKCLARIAQLKANGCAVILISHNAEQIQLLCDQALWLDQGQVQAYGEPNEIANQFADRITGKNIQSPFRNYSRQVEIQNIRLKDAQGKPLLIMQSGDGMIVELNYITQYSFRNVIFSVSISDQAGQIYCNTNTQTAGLSISLDPGTGTVRLHFARLDLPGGSYFINAGVFADDWSITHDYQWQARPFQIHCPSHEQTLLYPPRQWEVVRTKPIEQTF